MKKLVLGNPGCGKTFNLVKLINDFIDKGYKPTDITVLSHTRVAAGEIASRAKVYGVRASTIHSLAYSIADISKDTVITNKEIKEFSESIGIAMKGYSSDSDESLETGDEFLAVMNYANAHMMPIDWAYNAKGRPGTKADFDHFYENYLHWKKVYSYVDFDDMIKIAALTSIEHNYPVLLIDECQDLSKSQWKLVDKISVNTVEMVVTGDPDQSLFKWGGAWPHGMVDWAKRSGAEINELNQSYRVPKEAYLLSRSIIECVKDRYEKDYKPTDKSGSIERYLSIHHYNFINLKSALILYRSHALRKSIEEQLIYFNKAYTTLNGTPGLCQNKYGKAVQAWLRIVNDEFPDKNDINMIRSVASPAMLKAIKDNDLYTIKMMKGEHALTIPNHMIGYYKCVNFDKMNDIQISTIHGAKGKEHDTVIIINGITQRVSDGALTDKDSELQVWYVAVTRTKDKLHIIDGEGVNSPL